MALAALLAFVANLAYLRSLDDSVTVVVAAHSLAPGHVIGPGDLADVSVRADAEVLAGLWSSGDELYGKVAGRPLEGGELVGRSDLVDAAAPDGHRAMAVPIDPAHAAGGSIRPGDRVDVVDIGDDGEAAYVVRDAPVHEVSAERSGALAGVGSAHIVLGLTEDQVLAVARAIADGRVDVVVTTGAGDG